MPHKKVHNQDFLVTGLAPYYPLQVVGFNQIRQWLDSKDNKKIKSGLPESILSDMNPVINFPFQSHIGHINLWMQETISSMEGIQR